MREDRGDGVVEDDFGAREVVAVEEGDHTGGEAVGDAEQRDGIGGGGELPDSVLIGVGDIKDAGVIGDIRGRGAMIAVEITKPGTDTPDPDMTSKVAKLCHDEGVLVLTAGTYSNVLRFLPPLVMPEHLLEDALTIIERAFKEATA